MEAIKSSDVKKKVELEMSWISDETNGKHEYVPSDLLEEATREDTNSSEEHT